MKQEKTTNEINKKQSLKNVKNNKRINGLLLLFIVILLNDSIIIKTYSLNVSLNSNNSNTSTSSSNNNAQILMKNEHKASESSSDSPYPTQDHLNPFIINTDVVESKPPASIEDQETEIIPLTASSASAFSWGFLNWNHVSFPASNTLSGHNGFWLSKRDVMDDHLEYIFKKPTKLDYLLIHWRLPPKRFRVFFKLKDDNDYIPLTELIEKFKPISENKKISEDSASEYNALIFNKPIFARRLRIVMNEPLKKKSFSVFKVKFFQKKTVSLIRNMKVDSETHQCLTVNTSEPKDRTPVYSYDCLKTVLFGDNRELFVVNPNKSITHYNSKLCLGFEHSNIQLRKCDSSNPAYKVNVNPDSSLSFEYYKEKLIFIDNKKKISDNYITEETEILVSSEFDKETLKKENIKATGNENFWSSHVGQGKVSMQVLFGKTKNGFDIKKVDIIKISWVHCPKSFSVYSWKPKSKWKLIKKFEDYEEKLTVLDLNNELEFFSAILITMNEGHQVITNSNVMNKSDYNDNYNIDNNGSDENDKESLTSQVVYAIQSLYIGGSFSEVRLSPRANISNSSFSFDFEEQNPKLKLDINDYNNLDNNLNSKFSDIIGLNDKLDTGYEPLSKVKDLAGNIDSKIDIATGYVANKMLPGINDFKNNELESVSNSKLVDVLKKMKKGGYFFGSGIKKGPGGSDISSEFGYRRNSSGGVKLKNSLKKLGNGGSSSRKRGGNRNSSGSFSISGSIGSSGASSASDGNSEEESFPEDCYEIKQSNKNAKSGYYWVEPECSDKGTIRVFCDFSIYGNAVDIYVKRLSSLYTLKVSKVKDIRYQCAKYGLFPIEIKNKQMVKRISQVILHHNIDINSNIVVPLGFDYNCDVSKSASNSKSKSHSILSFLKTKVLSFFGRKKRKNKSNSKYKLKCSGEFRSINDKSSDIINHFFSTNKSNSKRPDEGEYIGLGFGAYNKNHNDVVANKVSFSLNRLFYKSSEFTVNAVVCSSNHFKTEASDVNYLDLDCRSTLLSNSNVEKFSVNSTISVRCPANCLLDDSFVYGNDIYDPFSSICKAGIHAGIVGNKGGKFNVKVFISNINTYQAISKNGIASNQKDYEGDLRYNKAFMLVREDKTCPIDAFKDEVNELRDTSLIGLFSSFSSFLEIGNNNNSNSLGDTENDINYILDKYLKNHDNNNVLVKKALNDFENDNNTSHTSQNDNISFMEEEIKVDEVDQKSNNEIKENKLNPTSSKIKTDLNNLEVLDQSEINKLEGLNTNFRFASLSNKSKETSTNKSKAEFDPYSLAKDAISNVANLVNDRELSKEFYEREYKRSLDQFDPRSSNYVPSYLRNLGRNFPFQDYSSKGLKDWADWNKRRFGNDPYYKPWIDPLYNKDRYYINGKYYNNKYNNNNPETPKLSDEDILKEEDDEKDNDNYQVRGTSYDSNPRVPDADSILSSYGAEKTSAKPFLDPIPPEPEEEDEEERMRKMNKSKPKYSTEEALKELKKIRQTNDFQRLTDTAKMLSKLNKSGDFFAKQMSVLENKLSPEAIGNKFKKLNKLVSSLDDSISDLSLLAGKRLRQSGKLVKDLKNKIGNLSSNLSFGLTKNLFSLPGVSPKTVVKNLFEFNVDRKLAQDKKGDDCDSADNASDEIVSLIYYM